MLHHPTRYCSSKMCSLTLQLPECSLALMSTAAAMVWNIDPVLLRLGPLHLRYYSVLMVLTILFGALLLRRHTMRCGYSQELFSAHLTWALLGFAVGARLGHCLIYNPAYFVAHPLDLFKVWRGGIASHGAALGLILATFLFSRRRKVPFLVLIDGLSFAAASGATLVRIGNFFNSEIVGRVTSVPWAVCFVRRDGAMRHPSQLYEACGGLAILIALLVMSSRIRRPPPGLFAGVFLVAYFAFRFFVEFFKEYHVLQSGLTMGQYLSVPFVLLGILLLVGLCPKRENH